MYRSGEVKEWGVRPPTDVIYERDQYGRIKTVEQWTEDQLGRATWGGGGCTFSEMIRKSISEEGM